MHILPLVSRRDRPMQDIVRSEEKISDAILKWPQIILTFFITTTSKWARWRLKSPASWLFTQPFIEAQCKENTQAPRHWPLWGEFTKDRQIPRTKGQWRGKCFLWPTPSCIINVFVIVLRSYMSLILQSTTCVEMHDLIASVYRISICMYIYIYIYIYISGITYILMALWM